MSVSEQRTQIEQVWTKTFRQTRQATQVVERQLQQEEKQLLQELANLRDSPCASEKIQYIERTLRQREATFESEMRQGEIAGRCANIELKERGLDESLREFDMSLQRTGKYLAELVTALQAQNWRNPTRSANPATLSAPPAFENRRLETISRIAGRDSEIDLLLDLLDNVLDEYAQRKRRRRTVLHGARILLFLALVFLADWLLNLVQPFEFYLLAAVSAWFLDEYFIRPALEKRFEHWNIHALQQTITDFYRAQRRALYVRAAFEKKLPEAVAVLETAEM